MSGQCDEAYAVYNETTRKARKQHKCDACRRPIMPGHFYAHVATVFDRSAETIKRCGACQATHLHLRELCQENVDDQMWPDERLGCGLAYEDEWGDLPDEIAELAFMTDAERGAFLAPKVSPRARSLSSRGG